MIVKNDWFWVRDICIEYLCKVLYFFFCLGFNYFLGVVFVIFMMEFEFVSYIFIFVFKDKNGCFVNFYCFFVIICICVVIYICFFFSVDVVIYFIDYFFVQDFEQNYFCLRIYNLFNSGFVCFIFSMYFVIFKFFIGLDQNICGFVG